MQIHQDRIIRFFYGIQGTIDERARTITGHISINLLFGLCGYLLISGVVVLITLFLRVDPIIIILSYVSITLMALALAVGITQSHVNKAGLWALDMTRSEFVAYSAARMRMVRRGNIIFALFFTLEGPLLTAFLNYLSDSRTLQTLRASLLTPLPYICGLIGSAMWCGIMTSLARGDIEQMARKLPNDDDFND